MARAQREPGTARTRPRRVAVWGEQHAWGFIASLRRLTGRPLSTLLTVTVMGFALALPLTFALLLGNLQRLGSALGQTQAISVFMQTDGHASDAKALADKLRGRDEVDAVDVRTPKQGMAELATMQGFSDALKSLDYNPLPYVVVIRPVAHIDAGQAAKLIAWLRTQPGVDQVQDDGAWRQRLDALLAVGTRAVLLLAVLLAIAALLVVGNSVRLDIQGRSDEIAVLRLVGASPAFVRRPYVYAGLWYGLAGGVVATLLTLLLEWALAAPVARLAASYGGRLDFGGLPWGLLALVPVLAAALGWLGARLVCARQLRRPG
ncbi:permease-like cell division protein FtsX [Oleiagrimonas citrea]|uniref:Cell division protein FtsX n=1 Tax=Oleiagrimonas citrea TaxID=1665687 RepID=A0A846ZLQ0_9GAMM|nr:permease-like cell division protein FtsX [Oleiagrimonas citrea]NKZ38488.1 ABC transporter permease [Oleiagrimonas citrea]